MSIRFIKHAWQPSISTKAIPSVNSATLQGPRILGGGGRK